VVTVVNQNEKVKKKYHWTDQIKRVNQQKFNLQKRDIVGAIKPNKITLFKKKW